MVAVYRQILRIWLSDTSARDLAWRQSADSGRYLLRRPDTNKRGDEYCDQYDDEHSDQYRDEQDDQYRDEQETINTVINTTMNTALLRQVLLALPAN